MKVMNFKTIQTLTFGLVPWKYEEKKLSQQLFHGQPNNNLSRIFFFSYIFPLYFHSKISNNYLLP